MYCYWILFNSYFCDCYIWKGYGSLASVSASRQGLFDKLKLLVTQEEINQYVKSYMDTNYPSLNYEILEMILDKENDQFMIKSSVVIEENGYFTDVIKYIL